MWTNKTFMDLEKLGFSVNESKVYLMLLQLGPSLAGTIAKEASLDRSSTYNALKLLVERGIVSTVHENKRTTYVPHNPKKILDYYKEKEELAHRIIPRLQQQYEVKKEQQSLELYQGYKGVKTVFQDILDSTGDEYYILGSEGKFGETMPYYAPLFAKLKKDKKLRSKSLIRDTRHKKDTSSTSEYKSVPSTKESPVTLNIYGNKVAIFLWEDKPEAIVIENSGVAETFRHYFEFMWKHAKKV